MELHAGLIIIVPNTLPALQRALFEGAILYLAGKDLVNSVIEVSLEGKMVKRGVPVTRRMIQPKRLLQPGYCDFGNV